MRLDSTNLDVAANVVRDILYMFVDMTEGYGGFGADVDTGSFDPFVFARSYVVEEPGHSTGIDQSLIVSGSLIAILCGTFDAREQSTPDDLSKSSWFGKCRLLLRDEQFQDFPDLREAVRLGVHDESLFHAALPAIYARYVQGYFRRLVLS